MTDEEKLADFLDMAVDQEVQAIGEDDTRGPWADLLDGAKFEDGFMALKDGRGVRISAFLISRAMMIKKRLSEAREGIFKFTMAHVNAYCSDPERKKKWDSEVLRPFYIPLSKIMGDKAEEADTEAGEEEAIELMEKIQAKTEELDLVNIATMVQATGST